MNRKKGKVSGKGHATGHATNLVTPSQYAEMRGLNRSTIGRQVRAGLIASHGGLINPVEADRCRASNVRQPRGGRARSTAESEPSPVGDQGRRKQDFKDEDLPQELTALAANLRAVDGQGPTPGTEAYARFVNESAKAWTNLRKAAVANRKYVELAAFVHVVGELLTAAKGRLRAIPNAVAPELALEQNPAVVQERLQFEIDAALTELAGWTPETGEGGNLK